MESNKQLINETQFSVRVVSIDFYMCPLEEVSLFRSAYENIDYSQSQSLLSQSQSQSQASPEDSQTPIFHNNFNRKNKKKRHNSNNKSHIRVPIVRIFGATPLGQHTCVHIHGAFPYIFIQPVDTKVGWTIDHIDKEDAFLRSFRKTIESALHQQSLQRDGNNNNNNSSTNLQFGRGGRFHQNDKGREGNNKNAENGSKSRRKSYVKKKRRRIARLQWVRGTRFYGYNETESIFLKVYLFSPGDVRLIERILRLGLPAEHIIDDNQPLIRYNVFESHVPFLSQIMMDYGLYGSGFAHFEGISFRNPMPPTNDVRNVQYETPMKSQKSSKIGMLSVNSNISMDDYNHRMSANNSSQASSSNGNDSHLKSNVKSISGKKDDMLTVEDAICWKYWCDENTPGLIKYGPDRDLPTYSSIPWPEKIAGFNYTERRANPIFHTDGPYWPNRQTTCSLELDVTVNKILNRTLLLNQKKVSQERNAKYKMEQVPSLRALWTEARRRKRIKLQTSYLTSTNPNGSSPSMPSSLGNKRDATKSTERDLQKTYRQHLRNYFDQRNVNNLNDCGAKSASLRSSDDNNATNTFENDILPYLPGGQISAEILPDQWPEDDDYNNNDKSFFYAENSQEEPDYLNDLTSLMDDDDDNMEEGQDESGDLEMESGDDNNNENIDGDEESDNDAYMYDEHIESNLSDEKDIDDDHGSDEDCYLTQKDLDAYEEKIQSQFLESKRKRIEISPHKSINHTNNHKNTTLNIDRNEKNSNNNYNNNDGAKDNNNNNNTNRKQIPKFFKPNQMRDEKANRSKRFTKKKNRHVETVGHFASLFTPKMNKKLLSKRSKHNHIRYDLDNSMKVSSSSSSISSSNNSISSNSSISSLNSNNYDGANNNNLDNETFSQVNSTNNDTQILALESPEIEEVELVGVEEETKKAFNLLRSNTTSKLYDIPSSENGLEVWTLKNRPPHLLSSLQTVQRPKNVGATAKEERYPSSLNESETQNSSSSDDRHGMNFVERKPLTASQINEKAQKNTKSAFSLDSGPQFMTILTVEVFSIKQKEWKKLPDPAVDEIVLIAYIVERDDGCGTVGSSYGARKKGYIALVTEDDSKTIGGPPYDTLLVNSEHDLLRALADLVQYHNPDILFGWEIEKNSWGYVVQRCNYLGIPIVQALSRCPLSRINGNNGHDMTGGDPDGTIRIHGRIVLSMWRLVKSEATLKLNNYSMENVAFELLRLRVPRYPQNSLAHWYSGKNKAHLRSRVIVHYMTKAQTSLDILYKLDIIGRTSEMARLIGIDFYSILWRGSQFRVESVMLRITKPHNYILLSPSKSEVQAQRPLDTQALTLEPKSGFYGESPVVVLDFQSLYPSLIIAYNMCYSTCIGSLNGSDGKNPGVSPIHTRLGALERYAAPEKTLRSFIDDKSAHMASNGTMFVAENTRRGILPQMLEEILNTRIMVKKELKAARKNSEKVLSRILDARQYALKMISNVTYGYVSASFSGRMPCSDIADAIVQTGRDQLDKAMHVVEDRGVEKAEFQDVVDEIIYGDTDSLFIKLKRHTDLSTAFKVGERISYKVSMNNYNPVKFNLEKVYFPCILQTKKRYVGWKYESPSDDPTFDDKGIETMRSDQCPVVANSLREALKALFRTKQGPDYPRRAKSRVKRVLVNFWQKMMRDTLPLSDYVFSRMLRNNYKSPPPHKLVDAKRQIYDKRAGGLYKQFIQYIIVSGVSISEHHVLAECAVSPEAIVRDYTKRLNDTYYIRQTHLVLDRMFQLKNMEYDIYRWYARMPRPKRRTRLAGTTSDRKTGSRGGGKLISQYAGFSSAHCYLCDNFSAGKNKYICDTCAMDKAAARLQLERRVLQAETSRHAAITICRRCVGYKGDDISCESNVCPMYYARQHAIEKCKEGDIVIQGVEDMF